MKHINFLSDIKKSKKSLELNVAVMIIVFTFLLVFSAIYNFDQRRKYNARLDENLKISAELAPLRASEDSEPVEKKVISKEVLEILKNPVAWSKILKELNEYIPQDVELKQIISLDKSLLSIEGLTFHLEAMASLKNNFAKASWCSQVELESLSYGDNAGELNSFSFKINCSLR